MQRGNVFSCICLCVCLSVCSALTFESLAHEIHFYSGTSSEYLGQVLYRGQRVKVKVTAAINVCVLFAGGPAFD